MIVLTLFKKICYNHGWFIPGLSWTKVLCWWEMGLGHRRLRFLSQLCQILATWLWANHLTFLDLTVIQLLNHIWLFCNPMDYSLPGFSVYGIFQARILEWDAIPFSRGSSWPRDQTQLSCLGRWILYHWATREALNSDVVHFKPLGKMGLFFKDNNSKSSMHV